MSFGYLYEVCRKSEDIMEEQQMMTPQRLNLKTHSEEDEEEIWEVPAESFDNTYRKVENENDDSEELPKEISKSPESSLTRAIEQGVQNLDGHKLHLSLSAEQISLKSQQQQCEGHTNTNKPIRGQTINRPIDTEEALVTRPLTVNTKTTNTGLSSSNSTNTTTSTSCIKWKNVKINKPNELLEKKHSLLSTNRVSQSKEAEEIALTNCSEIKLSPPPPAITKNHKKQESTRKFSLGSLSLSRQHVAVREPPQYLVSPEVFLDNILNTKSEIWYGCNLLEDSNNPFKSENQHFGGDESKLELKTFPGETTKLSANKHHQVHGKQQTKPSIIVTRPVASSSLSTLNNVSRNSTSSETFETASIISR